MQPALIIFIKNPVKGRVKTRLGRAIGNEQALQVYNQLCLLTREIVKDFPGNKYLFYSDEINLDDEWSLEDFNKQQQHGQDLGERMAHAFEKTFKQHNHIILIGSDCPYLGPAHIKQAIQSLESADCVIGPAKDGGYYLLGLRHMIPELFTDKNWSTQTVFTETLNTLKELNHSYLLLETLEDIDEISDWERYLKGEKLKN